MWRTHSKEPCPKPRWNPSTSPSGILRRPSSGRPPPKKLSAHDKPRRASSLVHSTARAKVYGTETHQAYSKTTGGQGSEVIEIPTLSSIRSNSTPTTTSVSSWFPSLSTRLPFGLGNAEELSSSGPSIYSLQKPFSSLSRVFTPMATISHSIEDSTTPSSQEAVLPSSERTNNSYDATTPSVDSSISSSGSTASRHVRLAQMDRTLDEYSDYMSQRAKDTLDTTLPRLFDNCSSMVARMRQGMELMEITMAGYQTQIDEANIVVATEKTEEETASDLELLKETTECLADATKTAQIDHEQEVSQEVKKPKQKEIGELDSEVLTMDMDRDMKGPTKAENRDGTNSSELTHSDTRDDISARSCKRLRQETTTACQDSPALGTDKTEQRSAADRPLELHMTTTPVTASNADQTAGQRKRKRSSLSEDANNVCRLLPVYREPSGSEMSDSSVAVAKPAAEDSSTRTLGDQGINSSTQSVESKIVNTGQVSRGSKICAWNDELCEHIFRLLECSTNIKIHFQLQSVTPCQQAMTSRLPVRAGPVKSVTVISPTTMGTSFASPGFMSPSEDHTMSRTKQRCTVSRLKMTGELNALIKGANDILNTIERYDADRTELLAKMISMNVWSTDDGGRAWIGDYHATLRSSLDTLDFRHLNRLMLCALELQTSCQSLFRMLRATI
ncbi:hypothetical protein BGX28_003519 [Mortierella sp. GBA30]|nr:hypothetical protein BGX28_003519 [Mortierella sp. GBA30]